MSGRINASSWFPIVVVSNFILWLCLDVIYITYFISVKKDNTDEKIKKKFVLTWLPYNENKVILKVLLFKVKYILFSIQNI